MLVTKKVYNDEKSNMFVRRKRINENFIFYKFDVNNQWKYYERHYVKEDVEREISL